MRKHSTARTVFAWAAALGLAATVAVLFPRGTSNPQDLPFFFRVIVPVGLGGIAVLSGIVWALESAADAARVRRRLRGGHRR